MRLFYKAHSALLICFAVTVVFSACADKKPAEKKARPVKAQPAGPVAQPPIQSEEVKVEKEVYAYDSKGRRDPFFPLTETMKIKPPRKIGSSPVENVDVEDIRLIAIAWDNQQYYAMITLPDNKSYTVRKGMSLGLYGGKIRDITRDTVIISEQVKDYIGRIKTKETILRLRKEGEE
jgi:Tfp pilus assembly protein PilP